MKRLLFVLLSIIYLSVSSVAQEPALEQKIAQMLMVGFRGTTATAQSDVANWLNKYQIGGVILFDYDSPTKKYKRNIESISQLQKLVADLKRLSKTPLFVAIDEEGGQVSRLKTNYGFKPTVTQKYLGTLDNEDSTRFYAHRIAAACKQVGINVNFAPLVDVDVNPNCPIIGKKQRSYSADNEVVIRNSKWFVNEHQKQGVLCVVKHFPGHGVTNTDSHESTPVVEKSLDALRRYELVPFAEALKSADGVMVAHILYPNIDEDRIASQSSVFITELLREEFGFSGIVMSDDFRMAGLRKQTTLKKAAVQFILAGGDLILCGANHTYQKQILEGLYAAAEDGTISEQRLNESVLRILSAKIRVTGWDPLIG